MSKRDYEIDREEIEEDHNVMDDVPTSEFNAAAERYVPVIQKYIDEKVGLKSTTKRIFDMITGPVIIRKDKIKSIMYDIKITLEAMEGSKDIYGVAGYFVERQEIIRGI